MPKLAPIAYGVLGAACLLRGLFRPHRALVKSGRVARCSGANGYGSCDAADTLQSDPGEPAYAVAPGKIVAVGEDFVNLLATNDTVILMYQGIIPKVVEGQYVGRGQRLGAVSDAGLLRFSVTEIVRSDGALGYSTEVLPPSAWLAARGATHFVHDLGEGAKWCEGGRAIHVPQTAMSACSMKRPEPGKFGLLPIEVDLG